MSRAKKTPFRSWESTSAGGIEKRYIRLGATKAARMGNLSDAAYRIFICMMMEAGGKEDFVFPRSKYRTYSGNDKFLRARQELIDKGFLEVVQNNANLRRPNVYRFSDKWKLL